MAKTKTMVNLVFNIIIKKLHGGQCTVKVKPHTTIRHIKKRVQAKLDVPVLDQTLVLAGKKLSDEQTIKSLPTIKENTKLYLFIKQEESLQDAAIHHFKTVFGWDDIRAHHAAIRYVYIVNQQLASMSWDDVNRLAYSCMGKEAPRDVWEGRETA